MTPIDADKAEQAPSRKGNNEPVPHRGRGATANLAVRDHGLHQPTLSLAYRPLLNQSAVHVLSQRCIFATIKSASRSESLIFASTVGESFISSLFSRIAAITAAAMSFAFSVRAAILAPAPVDSLLRFLHHGNGREIPAKDAEFCQKPEGPEIFPVNFPVIVSELSLKDLPKLWPQRRGRLGRVVRFCWCWPASSAPALTHPQNGLILQPLRRRRHLPSAKCEETSTFQCGERPLIRRGR
jgi:hypothetical protein